MQNPVKRSAVQQRRCLSIHEYRSAALLESVRWHPATDETAETVMANEGPVRYWRAQGRCCDDRSRGRAGREEHWYAVWRESAGKRG
jgi:hypothetical protein